MIDTVGIALDTFGPHGADLTRLSTKPIDTSCRQLVTDSSLVVPGGNLSHEVGTAKGANERIVVPRV
jgi:hypothetical protein